MPLNLPSLVLQLAPTYEQRAEALDDIVRTYKFYVPKVRTQHTHTHTPGSVSRRSAHVSCFRAYVCVSRMCVCVCVCVLSTQARASKPVVWCERPDLTLVRRAASDAALVTAEYWARSAPLHTSTIRGTLFFPDRRLLQFDCGKLQVRATHAHTHTHTQAQMHT